MVNILDYDSDGDADSDSDSDTDEYCNNLQPTGNGIGDIAENWTLKDAKGNDHSLHDYCGKVIIIEDASTC